MSSITTLANGRSIFSLFTDTICTTVVISVLAIALALHFYQTRGHVRTTRLKGPPRESFIYGIMINEAFMKMIDPSNFYVDWANTYGLVYQLPWTLGTEFTVLCDPKALAHFFAQSSWKYHQLRELKLFTKKTFGHSLLITEGEVHMRQRRAMSPAFSNSAIRDLLPIFLNSAYELKAAWDTCFQSEETDTVIIEVQDWMNRLSLDSIGEAGFSHRFGSIKDRTSPFMVMLDSFGDIKPSFLDRLGPFLAYTFPDPLVRISDERRKKNKQLNDGLRKIATDLLAKAAREQASNSINDRSMLGILVRSASAIACNQMSQDEMVAQHLLITAGNENIAAVLTWALIELSYHPDVQDTLRAELGDELGAADPKYEHLADGLPYLDAFTSEVLRLHPPLDQFTRVASEDDVIPLSRPIQTASGEMSNCVSVSKGTLIRIPIAAVNKSQVLWGDDALEFKPQRWLDGRMSEGGQGVLAAEIQGYRHLLTFGGYGPRTCPGRQFAVMQLKLAISVLVRHFSFAFPHGSTTKVVNHIAFALRAKVDGEEGPRVPLIVKNLNK